MQSESSDQKMDIQVQKTQQVQASQYEPQMSTFKEFSQQTKVQCSASNVETSSENINHSVDLNHSISEPSSQLVQNSIFSEEKLPCSDSQSQLISKETLQKVQEKSQNIIQVKKQQSQKIQKQQNIIIKANQQIKQLQKDNKQQQSHASQSEQQMSALIEKMNQLQISDEKVIQRSTITNKEQQPEVKPDYHQIIQPKQQEPVKIIQQKQSKAQGSKQNEKDEILKQISQIQSQLQLGDCTTQTQTGDKLNYDEKETALQQKIKQITQSLQQLQSADDQDNQFFIQTCQQQLKKAQRLKQCYLLLKNTQSKSKSQYQQLLEYFKLQQQPKAQLIISLQKKHKTINNKLTMLNKSKSLKQQQKQQKIKFQNQINQLKRLRQIIQTSKQEDLRFQQSRKIEPQLIFVYESKKIAKVKIEFQSTVLQMFKNLKEFDQNSHFKFYLKTSQAQNKNNQIDPNLQLSKIISQPLLKQYICQIQECIEIKFDSGETKLFKKGIDLTDILKKQKIRGKNYSFFSDFEEYDNQTAQKDLQLRECQICDLRYFGKIHKSMLVPLKVQVQKLIQYIEFDKMDERLQTTFISKVKILSVDHQLNQKKTLHEFVKSLPKQEKIQQIIIEYKIHLRIYLISSDSRQIDLIVNSNQKISKLKQNLQKQCNIDKKLQKWTLAGQQIMNQTCFEQLKIFHSRLRLEVSEIKNLEYYGFQTEEQINSDIYTNFYIEDDQMFKNKIESSTFPEKSFQYKFRVNVLSKIFSCIKKHCKIKTGLDSIKSIVAGSNKRCNLWMPSSSQQQTLFNQNYVLLHILNSAKKDLAIQLCRTYKNHSPIPLKTVKLNGKVNDMREIHYWICTKSLNIVSLDIFGEIKGKSTFLNEIFKTDFQTTGKHPISKKSVFIKYDIYRNPNYLVDLIDVASNSMNEKEKIKLCQHANIIIIHLLQSQEEKVKKWTQQNCKGTPIIYVFRESNEMKNEEKYKKEMQQNKSSKMQKNFHIINIQKQSSIVHHQYKFREISNLINQFIIQVEKDLQPQKKWLLNKYFQNNKKNLIHYTSKLRLLQKQFSNIVDLKLLSGQSENKASIKNAKVILDLIDIQNSEDISNFMSKMKEFSRIQRTRNLFLFSSNLQKIKNILEKKKIIKFKVEKNNY